MMVLNQMTSFIPTFSCQKLRNIWEQVSLFCYHLALEALFMFQYCVNLWCTIPLITERIEPCLMDASLWRLFKSRYLSQPMDNPKETCRSCQVREVLQTLKCRRHTRWEHILQSSRGVRNVIPCRLTSDLKTSGSEGPRLGCIEK